MFSLSWLNSLVGGFFIATTKRALPEFLSLADAYSKTPYCLWQPACAFALGVLSAWGVLAPVTHMVCSLSSPRSLLWCHPLHNESFSENSFENCKHPRDGPYFFPRAPITTHTLYIVIIFYSLRVEYRCHEGKTFYQVYYCWISLVALGTW